MTTLKVYDAVGVTDGTTLVGGGAATLANGYGSGDTAFQAVSTGIIVTGEGAVIPATTSGKTMDWTSGLPTGSDISMRVEFTLPSGYTPALVPMLEWFTAAVSRICAIAMNASGQLRLNNNANSQAAGTGLSSVMAAGTYAAELTSVATTGSVTAQAWSIDSFGIQTSIWSQVSKVVNGTTTVVPGVVKLGRDSSTSAGPYTITRVEIRDTAGTIGPANIAPTLTVEAPKSCSAGDAFTFHLNATDLDGTISTYATSVISPSTSTPTLTGASTADFGGTAPAGGSFITFQSQATDNGGLPSPLVTTELYVLKTGGTVNPLPFAGTTVGSWTRTGGTSDGGALADASNSTYVQSPTLTGSVQSFEILLEPSVPLSNADSAVTGANGISITLDKTDSGTATVVPKLIEYVAGVATVRKTWAAVTCTTSIATVKVNLTAAEASTVTQYGKWAVRFEVTT